MPSQDWYLTEYAGDVVDYLTDQHDELQTLLGTVLPASGRRRQAAFDAVRELLARHEAAEEAVFRPLVRALPGGQEEAAERTREEQRAEQALGVLEQLDVDSIRSRRRSGSWRRPSCDTRRASRRWSSPCSARATTPTGSAGRAALEAVEAVGAVGAGRPPRAAGHGGAYAALLDRARGLSAHLSS